MPRATRAALTVCPPDVRTAIPAPAAVPVSGEVGDLGVLVDADAEPLGRVGQPPRQPGGVDQRVGVALPEAGEVRRRGDLGADRLLVEVLTRA